MHAKRSIMLATVSEPAWGDKAIDSPSLFAAAQMKDHCGTTRKNCSEWAFA
jgi:hypothetical protein